MGVSSSYDRLCVTVCGEGFGETRSLTDEIRVKRGIDGGHLDDIGGRGLNIEVSAALNLVMPQKSSGIIPWAKRQLVPRARFVIREVTHGKVV